MDPVASTHNMKQSNRHSHDSFSVVLRCLHGGREQLARSNVLPHTTPSQQQSNQSAVAASSRRVQTSHARALQHMQQYKHAQSKSKHTQHKHTRAHKKQACKLDTTQLEIPHTYRYTQHTHIDIQEAAGTPRIDVLSAQQQRHHTAANVASPNSRGRKRATAAVNLRCCGCFLPFTSRPPAGLSLEIAHTPSTESAQTQPCTPGAAQPSQPGCCCCQEHRRPASG